MQGKADLSFIWPNWYKFCSSMPDEAVTVQAEWTEIVINHRLTRIKNEAFLTTNVLGTPDGEHE